MYKRRIKVFLGIVALTLLTLALRVGYLQLIRGDEYRRQAAESLQRVELLPARRGRIMDRTGRFVLAKDEACHDLCLDYRFITRNKRWIRRRKRQIVKAEGVSPAQAEQIFRQRQKQTWRLTQQVAGRHNVNLRETVNDVLERVQKMRRRRDYDVREQFQPHPIIKGLDNAEAVELKSKLSDTVGMAVRPSHRRLYPYGHLACHVIGMTGLAWREDEEKYNLTADEADWLTRMRSNYLPWDTIGRRGVEAMGEKVLRGKRGYRLLKRTSDGLAVLAEQPAEHGKDVHLTLDMTLQTRLTQMLMEKRYTGCVVVLSVPLGEVLALVSVPTFDLNRYRQDYELLATNVIDLPLLHRAVARRYPPGSTAKPISALAGLHSGRITVNTTYTCYGCLNPNYPGRFRCWYRPGHGQVDLRNALRHSCNVYFYNVGNAVGLDYLSQWFLKFGFGEPPGTGLPCERRGLVPTPDWLRRYAHRAPRPADARFLAVGQGAVEATPLHVANAMATIARDGKFLSPILALECGPKRIVRDLKMKPAHYRAVQEGMYRVVNSPGGTAHKVFYGWGVRRVGVTVCGKTGTAQTVAQRVDSNNDGRITTADRVVRRGDMAWFAGFAPRNNPKIAFAVLVEYVKTGGGSRNAGPIGRETIRLCEKLGYFK